MVDPVNIPEKTAVISPIHSICRTLEPSFISKPTLGPMKQLARQGNSPPLADRQEKLKRNKRKDKNIFFILNIKFFTVDRLINFDPGKSLGIFNQSVLTVDNGLDLGGENIDIVKNFII